MPGPSTAQAMTLDDYLTETMRLLEEHPDANEVLVERVEPLRFSETRGERDALMARLMGSH